MICENCGKEYFIDFRKNKQWIKAHPSRFCSRECQRAFITKKSADARRKDWICKKCGEHFETERKLTEHIKKCNPLKQYTWECKYCNAVLSSRRKLRQHILDNHQEALKNYNIQRKRLKPGETHHCKYCGADLGTNYSKGWEEHRDFCNVYKTHLNENGKFIHHWSEKEKTEISERQRKYYLENPEKHPWKNNSKFVSSPCEFFKNFLKSHNIEIVEEFSPLSDRNYSIDIAIPKYKIGIEINGDQHYKDRHTNELKEYYQERHNLICEEGWTLLEIHYYNVYIEEEQEKILNCIKRAISEGVFEGIQNYQDRVI